MQFRKIMGVLMGYLEDQWREQHYVIFMFLRDDILLNAA